MKRLVGLLLFILFIINCSGETGARDQIRAENDVLKIPLYLQAYRLYYEKKYQEGYALLTSYAFAQNGKSLVLHDLLVKFAHKLNKIDEVMASYSKLPQQRLYLFAKGALSIVIERDKQNSLTLFKRLNYFFPENPIVQMYLGYLYILHNKPHIAEKILSQSVSNLDNFPFNRYYHALALYYIGNKEDAVSSLNKAINYFPAFMQPEIEAAEKLKKKLQS